MSNTPSTKQKTCPGSMTPNNNDKKHRYALDPDIILRHLICFLILLCAQYSIRGIVILNK